MAQSDLNIPDYSFREQIILHAALAFAFAFSGVIARAFDRPRFPIRVSLLIGSAVVAVISGILAGILALILYSMPGN